MPKNPQPIVSIPKISKKERKSIISDFHVLLKQKEALKRDKTISNEEKKEQQEQIEEQMSQMGGLQRYQQASLYGVTERKFDTSKWCIQQLKDGGQFKKEDEKLKLLDCGSITDSYRKHQDIFEVTAIDLNPHLPTVKKADFFEAKFEDQFYDIIVLSLILNFVTDPCKRADMLMKCHRILKDNGTLFIILPRPCVANSRYLTHHHFTQRVMRTLGFTLRTHHMSPKLAFYAFTLTQRPARIPYVRREVLNDGEERNNFSIIIRLDPGKQKSKSTESAKPKSSESEELELSAQIPKAKSNKRKKKTMNAGSSKKVKV